MERPSVTDNDDGGKEKVPNENPVQVKAQDPQHDVVRGPDLFHYAESSILMETDMRLPELLAGKGTMMVNTLVVHIVTLS
jgi:hypothetical protein